MTSRPRSSNTRTFQIGSPSEFRTGVDRGVGPLAAAGSWPLVDVEEGKWLRLSILPREATTKSQRQIIRDFQGAEGLPTCRSRSVCWWPTMIGGKCLHQRKLTEDRNQRRRFRHSLPDSAPSLYTVVKIEGGLKRTSTH